MNKLPRYAYIHFDCKKPAFYMDEVPEINVELTVEMVTMPDGEHPLVSAPVLCGSCRKQMMYFSVDDFQDTH